MRLWEGPLYRCVSWGIFPGGRQRGWMFLGEMFTERGLKLSQTNNHAFCMEGKTLQAVCHTPPLQQVYCSVGAGTAKWYHLTYSLAKGVYVPPGRGSRSGRNLPSQGFHFIWHAELSFTSSGLVSGSSSVQRAKYSGISTGGNFFICQRGERIIGPELLNPCKKDRSL